MRKRWHTTLHQKESHDAFCMRFGIWISITVSLTCRWSIVLSELHLCSFLLPPSSSLITCCIRFDTFVKISKLTIQAASALTNLPQYS
ncbi:hypothetical protein BDZ45DRAFT_305499 [Acephala macrosclerotiorum]|nr:hypothetical protein BDZ45DRAFT_305499 [Acephala macrosclerotiorum]